MYNLAKVKPKDLKQVKVENQQEIVERTGRKFEPIKAYELIKKQTKDFTKDSDKAKHADSLFAALLEKNGISLGDSDTERNRLRIREQERLRLLAMLELELELEAGQK